MTDAEPRSASSTPSQTRQTFRSRRPGLCALGLIGGLALALGAGEVAVARARWLLDQRRDAQARSWLNLANGLSPRRGEVHFLQARLARREARYDDVRQYLTWAQAAHWPIPELEREQWLALAQTGQFEALQPHWQDLFLNAGADGPEICRAYVLASMKRCRLADARRVLAGWKADFPQDAGPYELEGWLHAVLLEWSDAVVAYQQALQRAPENQAARRGLAEALMKQLQFASAAEHWSWLLQQDPADSAARVGLAECHFRQGDVAAARTELSRVLSAAPDHYEALMLSGQIELADNQFQLAVKHLQAAVEQRPEDAEARYVLGRALRSIGDTVAAEEHLEYRQQAQPHLQRLNELMKQLPTQPADTQLRGEIAELTWQWKSRAEGCRWWQSILDVNPRHEDALRHLAERCSEAELP